MAKTILSPELIEAYHVGQTEIPHRFMFNDDVTNEKSAYHSKKSIELEEANEKLAAIKKEFSAKIKVLKSELKTTITELRLGYKTEIRAVFMVPDFDDGTMNFYDKDTSELLDFRKLLPEEKQLDINQPTKQQKLA